MTSVQTKVLGLWVCQMTDLRYTEELKMVQALYHGLLFGREVQPQAGIGLIGNYARIIVSTKMKFVLNGRNINQKNQIRQDILMKRN